ALVHVELAGDLDLQRVDAFARPAIMTGDIATSVRVVAAHRVAECAQKILHQPRRSWRAGGSVRIAEHETGPLHTGPDGVAIRWHGMAVDEQADAELGPGRRDESRQCFVER